MTISNGSFKDFFLVFFPPQMISMFFPLVSSKEFVIFLVLLCFAGRLLFGFNLPSVLLDSKQQTHNTQKHKDFKE